MYSRKGFGGERRFERRERRPFSKYDRKQRPVPPIHEGPEEVQGQRVTRLVVPGEMLAETARPMPFAFIDGGKTYSSILGLFDQTNYKLVPLKGPYIPSLDDYVVGVVQEVKFAGYAVDIKCAYPGFLSGKETREEFNLGDVLLARVKGVDEVKNVNLTDARKLNGGEIVEIPSVKVPRVIGKKSSMLTMITRETGSEILVGKNGRIWIKGGNTALAAAAILKIEKEAHTSGLTDRISMMLKAGK